jgi:hypothetical protein
MADSEQKAEFAPRGAASAGGGTVAGLIPNVNGVPITRPIGADFFSNLTTVDNNVAMILQALLLETKAVRIGQEMQLGLSQGDLLTEAMQEG